MDRQKQIIEIKECVDAVYGADCAYYDVDGFAIAEEVYKAGYRKQSENTVEVVRCRECKHYNATIGFCNYHTNNAGYCDELCWVTEDDFCSYGERIGAK